MTRLSTRKAADYLGCSESYLRAMRKRGGGPRFSARFPGKITYDTDDLDKWVDEREQAYKKANGKETPDDKAR